MALGVVPGGRNEDAVFDMAIGKNEHHQSLFGGQGHEIDMLDRRLVFRGEHEACALRRRRKGGSHTVEHALDIGGIGVERAVERLAILGVEIAYLQKPIDEQTQAHLRGHPSGGGMRTAQQGPEIQDPA
jgi:hypothetical protein